MEPSWRNNLLTEEATVLDAIRVVDATRHKVAVVVDKHGRLLGTITDGDVRRGVLAGATMDTEVSEIMNSRPRAASVNDSREFLVAAMRSLHIRHMPVIDYDNRVVGLESLSEIEDRPELSNPVVLMAGGQGMRLRPLTEKRPKPLLEVGERPMLETIILELATQGFRRFHLSLCYLGDQIREYFGDGERLGVEIHYLEEASALGTAGSLALLSPSGTDPIIVSNCDVLTKLDFRLLLQNHRDRKAEATMCVSEHTVQIPYGVVEVEGWNLRSISEKPRVRHLVNAGIYVISPSAIDLIPRDRPYDMTELFSDLLERHRPAIVFPIREYWLDVGRQEDLHRAKGEFTNQFGS